VFSSNENDVTKYLGFNPAARLNRCLADAATGGILTLTRPVQSEQVGRDLQENKRVLSKKLLN
jgi:hypothetical protein